jgi:DNA-binding response OmpR family regulator
MKYDVLVVDDETSVLYTVKRILESADLSVCIVNSGKECLEELGKGFKGLILMDVMMPEMDGWDTIKEIVKLGYIDRVIICMLTAKDVPDEKMDVLKEYVLDYITKPFKAKKLVAIVKEYLSYI